MLNLSSEISFCFQFLRGLSYKAQICVCLCSPALTLPKYETWRDFLPLVVIGPLTRDGGVVGDHGTPKAGQLSKALRS